MTKACVRVHSCDVTALVDSCALTWAVGHLLCSPRALSRQRAAVLPLGTVWANVALKQCAVSARVRGQRKSTRAVSVEACQKWSGALHMAQAKETRLPCNVGRGSACYGAWSTLRQRVWAVAFLSVHDVVQFVAAVLCCVCQCAACADELTQYLGSAGTLRDNLDPRPEPTQRRSTRSQGPPFCRVCAQSACLQLTVQIS